MQAFNAEDDHSRGRVVTTVGRGSVRLGQRMTAGGEVTRKPPRTAHRAPRTPSDSAHREDMQQHNHDKFDKRQAQAQAAAAAQAQFQPKPQEQHHKPTETDDDNDNDESEPTQKQEPETYRVQGTVGTDRRGT